MNIFNYNKKMFLEQLDKIIEEQDYSKFSSFFNKSTFKDFVIENKIDLSINNNFYIKKIISKKRFIFLHFFWFDKNVNKKLKIENPEIYNSCSLYYEIDEAIKNNNIKLIKKLLKNSFKNTIIVEDYYLNSHLLRAGDQGKTEIFKLLLKDGRFDINHLNGYAIGNSVLNYHKDIFFLILNQDNLKFNKNSTSCLISCLYDNNNIEFFKYLMKNNNFKENIQKSEKSISYYNKMLKKLVIEKLFNF